MDLTIGILGKDEFKPIAICAIHNGPDSDVIRVKGADVQRWVIFPSIAAA